MKYFFVILGFIGVVFAIFSISFFPILLLFTHFLGDWGYLPAAIIYLSILVAVNRKISKLPKLNFGRSYDR